MMEDEVMEVALRGRRPRQDSQSSATISTTSTNGDTEVHDAVDSSTNANGSAELINQEQNGKQETSIFVKKGTESIDGFHGLKDAIVDIVYSKPERFFPEVSSLPPSKMIVPISSTNQGTTGHGDISLIKEVAELYLERVFEKPAAHEFYCPNCNSCIKKVIIRGNEEGSRDAQRPEPVDTFRCTSCFSFLIPIGNWFFPNLVPKGEEDTLHEKDTVQVPSPDSSTYKSPTGGTPPLDQTKAPSSETVHDEDTNASVMNQIRSPVATTVNQKQIYGTTGPQEADRNNAASSKQGSKPLEVIIVGGRKVDDAGPEAEPPLSRPVTADSTEGTTDSELRGAKKLEIVKSIVYGGLIESITSLSVVTSAAGAEATTLSIISLSLANLIGGIFTIAHNLSDLKSEQPRGASSLTNEQVDRYQELLGRRENFLLHATIALLSFLVFGLVPPAVYGFTFMETDDKNFKLAAVAVASLLCITILAIGKAYIQKPPKHYLKTVLHYFVTGIMASGVSYVVGDLARKLIEKLGWFESGEAVPVRLAEMSSGRLAWASY
ncbi:PREDICTED: membrane protein of ER body 1-like [Populus euphratica]|uniref:Membrane protein of ER body 1-like n=1 Tax=Populus euphratica TaxID=75702 RepID=A0AAJ6XH51_POPEU|nr:PREDICTED: membrane protein of ER body 1-like [Populus euphratica]